MPPADLRLDSVTAPLHVDPSTLQAAAAAQSGVAAAVAGLDIGGAFAGAGDGMANLSSGAACRFAGESFDAGIAAVHSEIVTYATNLAAAAAAYQQADEQLGDRIGKSFSG